MPRYHHLHYIWLQVLALATVNASARSNYTANSKNTTTGVIASIPSSWTYLLPDGFYGNVNGSFINDTTTSDSRIDSILHAATQAPFIAYDAELYDIFGNSQITLIQDRTAENEIFPFEAGVWVPERDEVWFASDTSQGVRRNQKQFCCGTSADLSPGRRIGSLCAQSQHISSLHVENVRNGATPL